MKMTLNQPCAALSRRYEFVLISIYIYMHVTTIVPVAGGSLIVTPRNIAVLCGKEVEMQCQTDDGKILKWYGQRPGSPEEEPLYSGYRFSPNADPFYTINRHSDGNYSNYSLVFNASVETAKRYKCQEPGSVEEKSAELIALVSDPRCNAARDDAFINITCGIGFHGNWAPVMEWTRCNNETIITSVVSHSIVQNYRSSSTLTIRQIGNDSASCYRLTTLFREAGRPLETSADNIPSYNHTICFKHPHWGNTSECDEARKDDINVFNSREKDVSTTLTIITIPISVLVIGIFVVICCCLWKKQSISKSYNKATVILMADSLPTASTGAEKSTPRESLIRINGRRHSSLV